MKVKDKLIIFVVFCSICLMAVAATRNFVPRADQEGTIGTSAKRWLSAYFVDVNIGSASKIYESGSDMYLQDTTNGPVSLATLAAGGSETNNLETVTTGITSGEVPVGDGADSVTYRRLLSSDVDVPEIGTATYDRLDEYINNTMSSGYVSGGAITDNSDGTVAVAAGTGYIRADSSEISELKAFDWSAADPVDTTDDALNYVYINYNAGSPVVAFTTDISTLDHTSEFVIGIVWQDATKAHISQAGQSLNNFQHTVYYHAWEHDGIERSTGLVVSEDASENLAMNITAGVAWWAYERHTLSAIDTSTDGANDAFTYLYRDGLGGWTQVASSHVLVANSYDDGDGTLGSITPARYGVHWVYSTIDGDIYVQYGQGNYILSEAEAATAPSTMAELDAVGMLIAKVIIQQGATDFYSVILPWTTDIGSTPSTDHGDLAGLADDDHTQYLETTDQNAGTDITADLEEETHASEHAVGGADTVFPADPDVDYIPFWDDSDGALEGALVGTGLSYDGTTLSASGGSGDSITKSITQASHTLNAGDWVYYNGTVYALADADSASTSDVAGVVKSDDDANTFTLQTHGYWDKGSALAGSAGDQLFLSETAGAETSTSPDISCPLGIQVSANVMFINIERPIEGIAGTSQKSVVANLPGTIKGGVFSYTSSTSITPTAGYAECNGSYYTIAASAHTLTSLAAGEDFHYIYIDDSASTDGGDATIIDSTEEPAYSATKQGWYGSTNTNDRCIWVVRSEAASATIVTFSTEVSGSTVKCKPGGQYTTIASSMSPNGTWQTPDDAESSTQVPVNASSVLIRILDTDAGSIASVYATSKEVADIGASIQNESVKQYGLNERVDVTDWIHLGASRNIRIAGASNDDASSLSCAVKGWAFQR